jgi:hypothetical protein
MAYDPMVSVLQGPQNPTMSALFPPPTHLDPIMLLLHGQQRLRDPNVPAYDPSNTFRVTPPGTPTPPPPWGGGGRITQQDPIGAMFAHPTQHLQHMAGDVLPFPVSPQVADMRRMRHEDMMQDMQARFGQPGLDKYREMWPGVRPIPLRPENQ